jgi:hypothetical protein
LEEAVTTVADALFQIAEATGKVFYGTLDTGCTSTVLLDAELTNKPGALLGGTAFILTGTYAGNTRRIIKHSAGQVTLESALLGSPAVGVSWAAVGPQYSRSDLLQALNAALQSLGDVTYYFENINELAVVAEQEAYNLPVTPILVTNVVGVWIGRYSVTPYEPYEHFHWREETGGVLRFLAAVPDMTGVPIRLAYNKPLPRYVTDASELPFGIELQRLKWEGAARLMTLQLGHAGKPAEDNPLVELINEAKDNALKSPSHRLPHLEKPLMLPGW